MISCKMGIALAATVLALAGAAIVNSAPVGAATAIEYGLIAALWP